ncbi:hypothetical protein EFE27_04785 [Leuconostoc citreum]|nr:hypothetical protein [Leuconostoc citreum]
MKIVHFFSIRATFDGGTYGIGMGIPLDSTGYQFSNQNKFTILNPSIIPLLASERPVKVVFKGDAPNGLTIKNNTTGQEFKYLKQLTSSDEFKLIGLVPIVNGVQRLGNELSNREFLDYAIGNNDIEIIGSNNFTIQFITRFYY